MHKLQTNKGARYFMIAFIVLFLIMLLRFFYIQAVGVVHNVNVKDLATEQHNKNGILEANRGTIYDQAGKVLVQDSTTYRVVVNLKGNGKLKNKDETAAQLADALEINKEDVLKNFHEGRTQVEIGKVGRNLTREKKEQIRKLKIPGVSFMPEKARCIRMKILHLIYLVLLDQTIKEIQKGNLDLKKVWINICARQTGI
ncbi:penicillin-binding protein [Bacillus anthracis]|nr:penicillin-binding protein [Bacillus anthracis]AIM11896.1 penicillin-binding protein [Bacillus anthracis]